jgi:hypothetical protein
MIGTQSLGIIAPAISLARFSEATQRNRAVGGFSCMLPTPSHQAHHFLPNEANLNR